jgi:hypothetical protein
MRRSNAARQANLVMIAINGAEDGSAIKSSVM